MTPSLVHFVAVDNDRQTWDNIVAAAATALGAEFGVIPERGAAAGSGPAANNVSQRVTWFDTFDWRLHKAGLTLEYVPGRGGSQLRLSSAAPDGGQTVV